MSIPNLAAAAAALRPALARGAVFVAAGAGLGVDSGLPDFRGPEGFWNAYPPYRHLGLDFADLANPKWFRRDPGLAWGFYGHRLGLYRHTAPHAGYAVLREWLETAPAGGFVFTSNVDGAFTKAGVAAERICEAHGSIHHLQCTTDDHGIWDADGVNVDADIDVDPATFRARGPLPHCRCGALARPNILMFGDSGWDDRRSEAQHARLQALLRTVVNVPVVVVEAGAGSGVPTVRHFSERVLSRHPDAKLVRVNVREAEADDDAVADRVIGVAAGAKAALVALHDVLKDGR